LVREYHKTFGELGALVKHQISHRARAFARLRLVLEQVACGPRRAREPENTPIPARRGNLT
jgi:hypothetical protein